MLIADTLELVASGFLVCQVGKSRA